MRRQKRMEMSLPFLEGILKNKGGIQPTITSNLPLDLRVVGISLHRNDIRLWLIVESKEFDEIADDGLEPEFIATFFTEDGATAASEQARVFAKNSEYACHGPVPQRGLCYAETGKREPV